MSLPVVLVCLGLAGLSVWLSVRFFRHPFSPFSAFYGMWFTALAFYNLHWLDYIPMRRAAIMLIALSLLSFGLGWILPYLRWDRRNIQSPEVIVEQVSSERLRVVIFICFVLGVVWAIAFISAVRSTIGLTAFIEAPSEIRLAMAKGGEFQEPLKVFDWLNVANVVLCSFYLFVLKGNRRWLIFPVLLFSVAALFLMQDRTHFFYAFGWTGFVLLHSMKITIRKIVVLMGVGVSLLLGQFLLVALWLGKVAENSPALMESANVRNAMVVLLPPYMYLTESFPSLQAYIDSAPASTHGSMTFYPVFKLLNIVDPTLDPPAIVADFVQVPFDSNTFTWLHQFYTDFGIAGVVLGSWFIGVLTSAVYFQMLRTRSFYSTLVNGMFCYFLALSIFTNQFTQGPAWYFLAIGFLIAVYTKTPAARLTVAEA